MTENAKWEKVTWAIMLSALLSGRAVDVYTSMSNDDANEYDKLKKALLTGYSFTEVGYFLEAVLGTLMLWWLLQSKISSSTLVLSS